jgi:hypothetical protein
MSEQVVAEASSSLSADAVWVMFEPTYRRFLLDVFSESGSVWRAHLSEAQLRAYDELKTFFKSGFGRDVYLAMTLRNASMQFENYQGANECHASLRINRAGSCIMVLRLQDEPQMRQCPLLEAFKGCADEHAPRIIQEVERMGKRFLSPDFNGVLLTWKPKK